MKESFLSLTFLLTLASTLDAYQADPCIDGKISEITIENLSIFDNSDPELNGRFAWVYRTANSLHLETRQSFVRRTLLFKEGDCYEPDLLEESERLLRGYKFIAGSDIIADPQADGSVHVTVRTRDEWSTQIDVRVGFEEGFELKGVRLSESNLLGTGRTFGIYYLESQLTRNYGLTLLDPQLGGTRWQLRTAAARTRAGTAVDQALTHPFVGEAGRWAVRQSVRREDRFVEYVLPDRAQKSHLLVPAVEQGFDVTVLRRLGPVGGLQTLVGGAISYQDFTYPDEDILLVPDGNFADQEPAEQEHVERIRGRLDEFDNARLHLLLGRRNVRWTQRQGLASVQGQEDVRLGVEATVAVAPPFPFFGSEDEALGSFSLYGGLAGDNVVSTVRVLGDARRVFRGPQAGWHDVIAEADAVVYLSSRAQPLHSRMLRASATGGWHTRTPFQLTLGGKRGLRGYGLHEFPGGRRIVLSAEERRYLGRPFGDLLAVGGTVFLEAGRIWPGDALFGVDSDWRAAVGVGLRTSFPAASRNSYRLDLALPLERGTGWNQLRFSVTTDVLLPGFGAAAKEPLLVRSRRVPVSSELFTFPD